LRHAIDVHPQKPLLPHLPFHINDFQPFRARHPLGRRTDPFQIHVKTPRALPVSTAPQPASTKKWACAHSSVRPLQSEFRVYSRATAKARHLAGAAPAPNAVGCSTKDPSQSDVLSRSL